MSTADRLRKKLDARAKARTAAAAEEAEKRLDREGVKRLEDEKKEAERRNKDAEATAKFKRLAFDGSVWLLDFDAIRRTVPNTPVAAKIYEELIDSCKYRHQSPSWDVSLPALSRDLALEPRAPLVVPCGGVVVEREPEEDDADADQGAGGGHPQGAFQPIPRENTFAATVRVWSVEDPNMEQRRRDEEAGRNHVGRFSAEPTEVWTTLCGRNVTKTIPILERYDGGENDPASKAALFSWSPDGEEEFDCRAANPVRACLAAAELLNRPVLSGHGAAAKVREAVGKLRGGGDGGGEGEATLRHPYASDQVGVTICRAETILGPDAVGLEDELVAVVHARHCVAHTIMGTPALVGAQRLICRALGSIVVGTIDPEPGSESKEPLLACYRKAQHCVVVVPYETYDRCMKHLRQQARVAHGALVPMGRLELLVPKKRSDTLADGSAPNASASLEVAPLRLPTRVNVVTVYVHFESCPTLLLPGESLSIGTGWMSVMLVLAGEKITKISASEWNEEANRLLRHCAQMLAEGKFDQLEIDEETGAVNIDRIASDRHTNPTKATCT